MSRKSLSNPEKWILIGVPVLFIIGSVMHFMYNICLENPIVGIFAPVNESIWEHSKMVVWPLILWWSLYYCFRGKEYEINGNKWFEGALVALVTSLITMPMLYYFYTAAFGVELLWVDILILLFSVLFGQLMGLHIYRYGKGINMKFSIAVLVIIVLMFMLFTFFPPTIPLFQDGVTNSYGIN